MALLLQPERPPHSVTAEADLPARAGDEAAWEPQKPIAEADQPAELAEVPRPEPAPPVAPEQVHLPVSAETRTTEGLDGLAKTTPRPPEPSSVKPNNVSVIPPTQKAAPTEAPATSTAGTRYAIQLANFRRLAAVASAARRDGILEQSSTLEPVRGWYPLLFGDYGTRAEAEAALDDLPEKLRRQGPIIRMLSPGTRPRPLRNAARSVRH